MYKVFLSSTSRDLTAYREAVHRAIDQLDGFNLVKMEDFGARDEAPRELCERLVGESQVLVGLLGHYYGSCPPAEELSFTELEYATAVEHGLPRVMFFAPDDFAIPASLREPDASFERQARFRAKVMAERVGASFASPEQLASAVTTALANWREDHERRLAPPTEPVEKSPPSPEAPLGPNPYRGLEAFRKEDAERFFGREALVEVLWQRFLALHKAPVDGKAPVRLLAILGASGSGKSSVAQAGLLAALDEKPLPGRPAPPSVVLMPEARPLESLAVALARLATGDDAPAQKAQEFEKVLRERKGFDGLRYLAAHMLGVERAGVILLIDQFEEVFSLGDDAQESNAFIGNLLRAAREPGQVSIVLTLRSDFLGEVNRHPELSRLIAAQNEVVPVMGEEDLRRAIEEPAKRAGRAIDPATVQLLLEQIRGRDGALPLLEFVLTRIWEGFSNGVDAAATVHELGGVGGALAKQAQAVYDGLAPGDRAIARRAFLAMVRLGEGTRDTRRRAPLEEMVTEERPEDRVLAVLRRFSEPGCRLISLSGTATATAEVAHEALFDHWRLLRDWLDESREDIRFQRRLSEAANHWDDMKRPDGSLWRPPELDLLRDFRSKASGDMTPLEVAFASASDRQEKRRRLFRLGGIAATIGTLMIIAGGLTIYSRQQAQIATQIATQEAEFGRQQTLLLEEAEKARREAIQERAKQDPSDQALRTQSLFLAEKSEEETRRGNATNGILLALEALPNDMSDPGRRPYVGEAEAVLYAAITNNRELADLVAGPAEPVRSAAFSPDGTQVVTVSEYQSYGRARLWDVASGKLLSSLAGNTGPVNSAAFSPDGTRVLIVSDEGAARLFDAASGTPLFALEGHTASVLSAAFSPDGTQVVTGSSDGTARLWDAASGKMLRTLEGHTDVVYTAAISKDGTRVVTASDDNTARLWDAKTGAPLFALEGHRGEVNSAAFSPDGTRVVTASDDNTARLWDADNGTRLFALEGHHGEVNSAAFSPDGTLVVTASDDNTAQLWDAETGSPLFALVGHTASVNSAAFSTDGTRLVTASNDGSARLWKATAGKLPVGADGTPTATYSVDGSAGLWDTGSGKAPLTLEGVAFVALSPDGTRVITHTTDPSDRTARLWDAATGKTLFALDGLFKAFSPDGTRVVTALDDNTARVWDVASGTPLFALEGPTAWVWSAAFSPDGTRVVMGSGDGTARLWDAASGKMLLALEAETAPVYSNSWYPAAISKDGTRVVTASRDDTARLWDAETGEMLAVLGIGGYTRSVEFSQDGTRVLTDGDSARLWDAASGELLVTLEDGGDYGVSAAFSPDGTKVVTDSLGMAARLWDAASGTQLLKLKGHSDPVRFAGFSSDGTRVVTGSYDGTARLWDAASGKMLLTLEGHTGAVYSAAISKDGTRVVTRSEDDTARLWQVFPTQALIDHARSIVPRQLTPEQRKQFFLE